MKLIKILAQYRRDFQGQCELPTHGIADGFYAPSYKVR